MSWLDTIKKLRRSLRLNAQDGMSITLDTWNAAHNYHHDLLRAALLVTRGWGIIDGMVITLDNTDRKRIHIGSGIAIDPSGHLLVFEGSSFTMQQQLSTSRLLDIGTVRITLQATQSQIPDKPNYVHESCQLILEMSNSTPSEAALELARIDLTTIDAELKWSANPNRPGKDELDQRFRLFIGAKTPIRLALVKLESSVHDEHLHGWRTLAREVSYTTSRPILLDEWSEQTLPTLDKLRVYDMICLIGRDNFVQDQGKSLSLEKYVQGGGLLFYESCRQNPRLLANTDDQQFHDWIKKLQSSNQLESIATGDLFAKSYLSGDMPYLFRQPPRGYEDANPREFKVIRGVGKGLILYGNLDYGCAFCGKFANNGQPSRSELRETFEWGHNLLALAGNRTR